MRITVYEQRNLNKNENTSEKIERAKGQGTFLQKPNTYGQFWTLSQIFVITLCEGIFHHK